MRAISAAAELLVFFRAELIINGGDVTDRSVSSNFERRLQGGAEITGTGRDTDDRKLQRIWELASRRVSKVIYVARLCGHRPGVLHPMKTGMSRC